MSARVDLTGQRFERLIALFVVGKDNWGSLIWHCRCDCGNEINVSSGTLRSSGTRSCGCLFREGNHLTHGNAKKGKIRREWRMWAAAKNRCHNTSNDAYDRYGGRGIKMCSRWFDSFAAFLEDMGRCPEGKAIDRINNDGDYEPSNCRWATPFEQNNNKRNVRKITFQGKTLTRSGWDLEMGYPIGTVARRMQEGCPEERAITMPYKPTL